MLVHSPLPLMTLVNFGTTSGLADNAKDTEAEETLGSTANLFSSFKTVIGIPDF